MKKKVLIIIAALAALSLSACSDKPPFTAPQVESEISSASSVPTMETELESSTESTSSFEQVSEQKTEEAPIADSTQANTSTERAQNQEQQPITEREPVQAPQTVPAVEPSVPQTSQPPALPASETEPTPEPVPETTPEPVQPSFDVIPYISYAKSYGQSIGLTLDSSAVSCWDDPISANASCIYLERDIRDRLDWYLASGYMAFWVWSVDNGGGNHLIYIGYA